MDFPVYHFPDFFQFLDAHVLISGKKGNHLFEGIAEIILDDAVQVGFGVILLRDGRIVFMGITEGIVGDESFFFQDSDDRGHRVIGWLWIRKVFDDVLHKSLIDVP